MNTMNTLSELPQLMASARARGWAQLTVPSRPMTDSQIRLAKKKNKTLQFKQQGLTTRGTPFVKRGGPRVHLNIHAHPLIQQLKGSGDRRKYHRVYMRLWRGLPVDDLE